MPGGIEDALAGSGQSQEFLEVERFFEKKDRNYAKAYLEEQAKYEKFHEQIQQGIHSCNVQRAACSRVDEVLSDQLVKVDKDIRDKLLKQRQERHAMETRVEKMVEEQLADVRGLMVEEQNSRKTGDDYTTQVTNEVCHLYNDVEQAKNYRLEKSERLQEVVSVKLDEIQLAISAESKIREESTQQLLETFGAIGTKMQTEINEVKRERKESTDRLLQLMEVVLPHLEQARLNHVKRVNERLEDQTAAAKLAKDLADKYQKRKSLMHGDTKKFDRTMTMESLRKSLPMLQVEGLSDVPLSASQYSSEAA